MSKVKVDGISIWFWCLGCKTAHRYTTDRWQWNGSLDKPTFTPSLLVAPDMPELRCHLFVTDGVIKYCDDCHHALKGQTMTMPDFPPSSEFHMG
jgi:hypothetical protein